MDKTWILIFDSVMQASDFLRQLKTLSKEDLIEIKGIGEVLAENILEFVDSDRYQKLIQDFQELESDLNNGGLQIISTQNSSQTPVALPLGQETICITGTFEISRSEIKQKLEAKGAKVTDSVSAKTTILLAGESAGSKLTKAQQLGIKVVSDLSQLI